MRSIDFDDERSLDRILINEFSTCGFAKRGQNIVLQGLTGTGKTYLACAIAKEACRKRIRSHYIRIPDLEEAWDLSRQRSGGEHKILRKYAFTVLVLDKWLLDSPSDAFRGFLLELMKARTVPIPLYFAPNSDPKTGM